jgi:flagellar biosynthesis/type III secretory pathway M-ring protein FliF/YscJ
MLCRVALVRTDVSEERSASIIMVHRALYVGCIVACVGLLVMVNLDPSSPILATLMMKALSSSETSVFTRATRRNIPEDDILHSHRRENLKSYIALTG